MRHLLRGMSGMHQHVRAKQLELQQEHRRLKTRLSHLRGKFVAALTRDERREAAYLPKRIAKTLRKLAAARKGHRAKYRAYRRVLERENRQLRKVHLRNLKPTATTVLGGFARAASTPYFFVMRGGVHSTMHVATEFCVDVLQERRQASFDTYRARL
jgi:hypothetical protein